MFGNCIDQSYSSSFWTLKVVDVNHLPALVVRKKNVSLFSFFIGVFFFCCFWVQKNKLRLGSQNSHHLHPGLVTAILWPALISEGLDAVLHEVDVLLGVLAGWGLGNCCGFTILLLSRIVVRGVKDGAESEDRDEFGRALFPGRCSLELVGAGRLESFKGLWVVGFCVTKFFPVTVVRIDTRWTVAIVLVIEIGVCLKGVSLSPVRFGRVTLCDRRLPPKLVLVILLRASCECPGCLVGILFGGVSVSAKRIFFVAKAFSLCKFWA